MEGTGRKELVNIIEQQKEKLVRYETRLKEVVKSYKALAKEKSVLESSLKAITDSAQEAEEVAGCVESASQDEQATEKTSEDANFRNKLSSLTANIANLSKEKAEVESKFLAERKKFKKEKEEILVEIEKMKNTEQAMRTNLEEVKSKLIIEKHDREQETNNNRLMMKELQKVLADERDAKEKLQEEVFSLKSGGESSLSPTPNLEQSAQVQSSRMEELKMEMETLKTKLQISEAQLQDQNFTKNQLRQLQQQLSDVRKSHHQQLEIAEEAREAAELRAVEIQKQQEQRVVNLEANLHDLSLSLAEYQRLRDHDQNDIERMRTRINLLSDQDAIKAKTSEVENSNQNEVKIEVFPKSDDKDVECTEALLDKVKLLKEDCVARGISADLLDPVFCLPWQDHQHPQLIEKLENKIKSLEQSEKERQGSMSSMFGEYMSNADQNAQIDNLKAKTELLHKKLSDAKTQINELKKEVEDKKKDMCQLKETKDREQEVLRMENKKKIGVLRIELEEQRSRSINLMEEKDCEIQRLQRELDRSMEEVFYSPDRKNSRTSPASVPSRKVSCDINEMSAGVNTSGAPLHYIQELSRKEVEVKELRVAQLQLESTLRELQQNMSSKEEKYQDTIDDLEDTVARLERMTTSEGANLEYLKNVVLTYMLSTDVSSKNHMLKAIGAVLKLSKSEIKRVMEQNAYSSWWSQQNASKNPNRPK